MSSTVAKMSLKCPQNVFNCCQNVPQMSLKCLQNVPNMLPTVPEMSPTGLQHVSEMSSNCSPHIAGCCKPVSNRSPTCFGHVPKMSPMESVWGFALGTCLRPCFGRQTGYFPFTRAVDQSSGTSCLLNLCCRHTLLRKSFWRIQQVLL